MKLVIDMASGKVVERDAPVGLVASAPEMERLEEPHELPAPWYLGLREEPVAAQVVRLPPGAMYHVTQSELDALLAQPLRPAGAIQRLH